MMAMKLTNVGILILLAITICGCCGGTKVYRATLRGHLSAVDKDRVSAYLASLPVGYPVVSIEKELGLPDPDDNCAAPTVDNASWWVSYRCNDLLIGFHASDSSPTDDGEPLRLSVESDRAYLFYAGNPSVMTMDEYVRMLERIGVTRSTK